MQFKHKKHVLKYLRGLDKEDAKPTKELGQWQIHQF